MPVSFSLLVPCGTMSAQRVVPDEKGALGSHRRPWLTSPEGVQGGDGETTSWKTALRPPSGSGGRTAMCGQLRASVGHGQEPRWEGLGAVNRAKDRPGPDSVLWGLVMMLGKRGLGDLCRSPRPSTPQARVLRDLSL